MAAQRSDPENDMDTEEAGFPAAAPSGVAGTAPATEGRRRQISLSIAIAALCLAVLTPPVLLAGYLLTNWTAARGEAEIGQLRALATDLRLAVDRELEAHLSLAQMLASSRALRAGDYETFRQQAEDAAAGTGGNFILTAPTMRYLVNTRSASPDDPGVPVDMTRLRQVLESGRPMISNLITLRDGNRMFSVRVPVTIDGEVRYVLSFVPNNQTLLEILAETYRPEGWNGGIVDGNGKIIARSRLHEEFFGAPMNPQYWEAMADRPSGLLPSVDLEGNESMTAFEASRLSDWYVLVWAPTTVLEEPAALLRQGLILLVALTLATSAIAAYGSARLVRQPARRLVAAATALGAGRRVEFAPTILKEANVVGDALTRAAAQIAARESDLRRNDEQLKIVMRELSHRSKNLLSVITAMIGQTGRSATDVASFRERMNQRIIALARSQDLLVQSSWGEVTLRDLARAQLEAFVDIDRRVTLEGPPLALRPPAAQALGMALHELATNSAKYGAISAPEGRIRIAWHRPTAADPEFRVIWQETGGPRVEPPERTGFGTVVVEQAAASSLLGTARLDWRPEGLYWELRGARQFIVE